MSEILQATSSEQLREICIQSLNRVESKIIHLIPREGIELCELLHKTKLLLDEVSGVLAFSLVMDLESKNIIKSKIGTFDDLIQDPRNAVTVSRVDPNYELDSLSGHEPKIQLSKHAEA